MPPMPPVRACCQYRRAVLFSLQRLREKHKKRNVEILFIWRVLYELMAMYDRISNSFNSIIAKIQKTLLETRICVEKRSILITLIPSNIILCIKIRIKYSGIYSNLLKLIKSLSSIYLNINSNDHNLNFTTYSNVIN